MGREGGGRGGGGEEEQWNAIHNPKKNIADKNFENIIRISIDM